MAGRKPLSVCDVSSPRGSTAVASRKTPPPPPRARAAWYATRSAVGRWSCTSPVWCDVDTTRLRKRTGPRSTGVNSTSGELLEHPVVAAAAEGQVLVAAAPGHAEHGLVVLGAGRIDDLDQHQLLRLGAVALRRVCAACGGLEVLARPAAVGGVRGGELLVDPREVAVEAAAGGLQLAAAGDRAADGEQDDEEDEHAQDD